MAVGSSGRVVIDIDPKLKKDIHKALIDAGQTMKDWFIKNAIRLVEDSRQPSLFTDPNSKRQGRASR
ncbi:MAG: hypothetical protein A2498_15060 [Lentisphaerae bacterium RIFOXYC12_FULL_60_16]|nr:MAG: hypothetical protein A2498_15060 [Lentisphaerae bacterium RIFOXYC12_FULL_60_16]OGV84313.1 MAG: hypothetical protein A2340_07895 [Lentisphaerae bacterium RIFOXYB12_FULL_60_10]